MKPRKSAVGTLTARGAADRGRDGSAICDPTGDDVKISTRYPIGHFRVPNFIFLAPFHQVSNTSAIEPVRRNYLFVPRWSAASWTEDTASKSRVSEGWGMRK